MRLFLIDIRDDNFYHLLPERFNGKVAKDGRVKVVAFPPLGIQTLASVVSQLDHQVRMFDTCHPRMKPEHIAQAIKEDRPEVIAISFLSATTYPSLKQTAYLLKQASPNTPIITGGPFATINAAEILRDCEAVDCVGVGEGEELLPDYLDHLHQPGAVAGLVWRNGKEVVTNPHRPLIQDLDRFPYPDRTSLPIDYIESLPLEVPAILSLEQFTTMQTSRGCPFHCIYCDIPLLSQGRWRHRSPEHVLKEMQQLQDQGYRSIYLTDDHFMVNRRRIEQICQGFIRRRLKFKWGCEGRVDSVAIDQMSLMKEANCSHLAFGIEAGTQRVLDRLQKNQTLEQVEHAVSWAKLVGIERVHGFFVIGSPGETESDVLDTFRFAMQLKLDTFGFSRLCAYRGTTLWKEYIDRGIIDDQRNWHKRFRCSDIDPTALSSGTLNRLRIQGYARLFAHRLITRPIQTWRLLRSLGRHMKTSDLIRLLSSPFRHQAPMRKPDLPAKRAQGSGHDFQH